MITGDLYQSPLLYGATFDEATGDGNTPRPHWAHLLDALRELGPEEIEGRWARAERRIRDNGITYNVYGDPLGANRPWKIDIVPLLISAEEWRSIEAGVKQRARLLNCLLEDLYGPQKLLAEGKFPAALLYANPAFLRALAGVPVPAHSYLHTLAIDLARSPDGRWWVLADRTQAPSGSGYALENRLIVSDVLPELFREANVLRLAPFFRAQRETLIGLAGCSDPRIVLLTPGPHNETYFEHSYLAKYMDLTLVEGADLTVRDRCVYLKTVGGLEKVDVILRRVDDNFCDPLELRSDSLLGVAGLVDAVVAGNVRVANALGSGLIESAAIMPFLPGLSKHLLGEELLLPSVATWWCGQPRALEWVVNHLNKVVVKPAFPALGSGSAAGMEPVFGSELQPAEREAFLARLRARPHEYVAQEQVALSTAPVWEGGLGGLNSRSVVLRTYALNTGQGWMVIPGGLVRVAEAHGGGNEVGSGAGSGAGSGSVVSMQRGGHSKDAWVLSEKSVDPVSLLPARDQPVTLRRVPSVVPSRVADNTFWLGRYAERAENTARILRSMVPRVRRADEAELGSLLRLHGCLGSRNSKLPKRKRPTFAMLERELLSLLSDGKRWDSLPSTLAEVARTGGNVRERLSADMTLLIHQLRNSMQLDPKAKLSDASAKLTGGLELLSTFSGMERENLIRGSGWLFLSLGRRMERAITLTRALGEITRPLEPENWAYMQWLLEVADSSMTYRQRYYTTLQPLPVLDVLLMDETNPRSLHFQLQHIADLYAKLPRHDVEELQAMQRQVDGLRRTDLQAMRFPLGGKAPAKDAFTQLDRYLGDLTGLLFSWSNDLSTRYFSHARTLPSRMG